MRCPYCQEPLQPDAPECPSCSVSFPKTQILLGKSPRLFPGLADTTRLLSIADYNRLKEQIEEMQERFPQLRLQVVLHYFPLEHPLSLHAFWLFNSVEWQSSRKEGKVYPLMLAVDPGREEAAIMPGYGLEEFLDQRIADHLLELASPFWMQGQWAEGMLRVLDGMNHWLESIGSPYVEKEGEF